MSQPAAAAATGIRAAERDLVRDLARRVAEISASPGMAAIRRRWRDVNALRRPDRAPVWCRPVAAWDELLPDSELSCTDPWLRRLERGFRQALVKHDIGDDTPLDGAFEVPAALRSGPGNLWGLETGKHRPVGPGGAWGYDPPLREAADFDRLAMPRFVHDADETRRRLERASELLGDILPVRAVCGAPLSATLGTDAADLMGLEAMMLNMAAEPELVHRLMAHLRDAALAALDAVEAAGLVTANHTGPMTESDPIGAPRPDGRISFANCWGAANSQEFDQVSPEMWEEFCLAYQRPLFARFGLVAYGCCENLTRKIDGVLSIPNLRVFVCSAWTDLNAVLEKVGPQYCIMWRQKASDVVFAKDEAGLRRDLQDGCRRLRGRPHQIVLRELQTLAGHPDRLHVWTRLAREAAERWA
ncbi:MAG TPA: uroporphyrinogen decarboxylase family protein [Planctomycetota bacterium]|nr:uroporphyrinogen decarboxylase family protein [Planctomycetota bacterium]